MPEYQAAELSILLDRHTWLLKASICLD